MMYLHYCKNCHRIHMLNGHKNTCPKCKYSLYELKMPYMDYINLSSDHRRLLLASCGDEALLPSLCSTYRMYKYSKWYKTFLEKEEFGTPYQVSAFISCDFHKTHPLKNGLAY